MSNKPERVRVHDPLSDEEFATVMKELGALSNRVDSSGRTAVGILLGLHGLRLTEACNLNCGDLEARKGMIAVRTIKRGKPRRVAVNEEWLPWLLALTSGQGRKSPLLRTRTGKRLHVSQIKRGWRRLSMLWLGRVARFHSLRHTNGQRLYDATNDLYCVQANLGHTKIETTEIYAEVSAAEKIRKHMPRKPLAEQAIPAQLFQAG